jgi:hypothetical protein
MALGKGGKWLAWSGDDGYGYPRKFFSLEPKAKRKGPIKGLF